MVGSEGFGSTRVLFGSLSQTPGAGRQGMAHIKPQDSCRCHGRIAELSASLRRWFEIPSKAWGIVKEYVLDLYFPAQRLTWCQRLRCAPVLFLVEYLVYRADEVAENARHVDLCTVGRDDADARNRYRYKATLDSYKATIELLLRCTGAHSEAVARQLELGERYIYLENRATSTGVASHAEVLRLAELRPSDVRLLHCMTFALLGRPVDNNLLDVLWPVEVLADIGNDLAHYHDDVAHGRFNTYDAFVRLYGGDAPIRLRAEIARYEHLLHTRLAKLPARRQNELVALCTRRYRAQTEVIPQPLLHDSSHRSRAERT